MIKVNKYKVQTVEHFDDNENSLGFLNEHESTDLRCQIAAHQADGYYLVFNGIKIPIQHDGRIENWPKGLYDTNQILLSRLFIAQK